MFQEDGVQLYTPGYSTNKCMYTAGTQEVESTSVSLVIISTTCLNKFK